MTAAVTPFEFEGNEVRTVVVDGELWFVLADICRVLDIANPRNVAARLDDDMKGVRSMDTPGGRQQVAVVNESGMYEVVIRSDKPGATAFRRWVTTEVLPAIRKSGTFSVAEVSRRDLAMMIVEAEDRAAVDRALAARLEHEAIVNAPAVEYVAAHVVPTSDAMTFRDAANHIGVGEQAMRGALVSAGWIYRIEVGRRWSTSKHCEVAIVEWRAKAAHRAKFELRAQHNAPRFHNDQVRQTLYVLAAGLEPIRRRLTQMGVIPAPTVEPIRAVDVLIGEAARS